MSDKALVVLSGGQDSTTCLYWALERFGRGGVETLTFDYGQRHRVELECAANVARHAGVPHRVLPIDTFAALGGNALTDAAQPVPEDSPAEGRLPATFVPGRNLVFLTLAAAWGWPRGIHDLVAGTSQTDYSGYPDCRRDTLDALERTLSLGLERDIRIHTPLMRLSKKETVLLAAELGALEAMALTHTCYRGERPPCGTCAACVLRAKGFAEAGIADPLLAR
ncbi:MAG TPA: 7-cyano-7-deazaguanine synthase QueC [Woeseiaceae bacterium]|nr:7-cyano-7-deazaguanine synthase QueC [Woeseiaceae bacterium]